MALGRISIAAETRLHVAATGLGIPAAPLYVAAATLKAPTRLLYPPREGISVPGPAFTAGCG